MTKIYWLDLPEEHDYPAAQNYLELIYPSEKAETLALELKAAPISFFKAKDIFRASKLSLLGISNSHVKKNNKKIQKGQAISPILLVRNENGLIVADGYHRLCCIYQLDEDAVVPCQII